MIAEVLAFPVRVQPTAPGGLLDLWAYYQTAGGNSPETIRARSTFVRSLAAAAGKPPEVLDAVDLVGYLNRDLAPWSRRTYYLHARAWFRWLVQEGYREDEPTAKLPAPRSPRTLPRPMSDDVLRRAITSAGPRTAAYLTLAAFAGLRACEIAQVRGDDFDDRMLTVRGKGGTLAMVPVHHRVAALREQHDPRGFWFPGKDGGHVLSRSVSVTVATHLHKQALPTTLHKARHWYGTEVLRASGGNLRVAQLCLRHASPSSTAAYTLILDDERVAAVDALPTLLGVA